MCGIGARRERIRAAVGPAIAQASYEVGPEFRDRFVDAAPENGRFFVASARAGHHMFDLAGYVAARLGRLGLAGVETVAVDTCAEERSEEHTSELQSLMRISYAVFCLKKKKKTDRKSKHTKV